MLPLDTKEFQPSSLSAEQQRSEMRWFVLAADRLRLNGIREVRVISEDLATHHYESAVLAKAFLKSPVSASYTTSYRKAHWSAGSDK
jgi:hypothetical protein